MRNRNERELMPNFLKVNIALKAIIRTVAANGIAAAHTCSSTL